MRTALRADLRLALTGWLVLAGLSLSATVARAATPPEKVLPNKTFLFVKVNNAAALRDSFKQSQFGQLWNDPALKEWKQALSERLDDASNSLKEKLGVTFRELLDLPQGTAAMAVVHREGEKVPAALVLSLDVGKNAETAEGVLSKATKQMEDEGSKVETEEYKGIKLHIIHVPKKANDKEDDKTPPPPPIIWSHDKSVFTIATDVTVAKEMIEHAEGREDSLASSETYTQTLKKFGSETQILWYIDVAQLVKMLAHASAANPKNQGGAQQVEAMLQVMGINGLKALAGSVVLNVGNYDSLTKTVVLAPAPVQGLLKIFRLPKTSMQPEAWVPASVASYQTISWDLDSAFTAVNDLVNMFQPGMLNVLEQQLVGPNGGEPLSFQKDIFGPLGNRITLISDYKKPIKEDSQRALLAVALTDSKTFQNTLNKLIGLANGAPKKREFQGAVIFDFDIPDMQAKGNAGRVMKGPVSVTVAKDTLFVSSEPTLLEQILRGGGAGLANSEAFRSVSKEFPEQVSSLSYVRPEEQARISYDMIKSGQFEKAMQTAGVPGGVDVKKFSDLLAKDKLPDFSVFAKYLSQGGGYSVSDDDGVTFTGFTLRKSTP